MKKGRLIALGIALSAGLTGAYFFNSMMAPPPPALAPIAVAPPVEADQILVASRDISPGTAMGPNEMQWKNWPKSAILEGMITKSTLPNAIVDFTGAISRTPFELNEPLRQNRLVKGANAGFLSAMLPSGKRAVAITVDPLGTDYAGGFVLPNDHVDVIQTDQLPGTNARNGTLFKTNAPVTLITNVRVIAIGQNIQLKEGDHVSQAQNVTLELTPQQAEVLLHASHEPGTHLSLVLRSIVDSAGEPTIPIATDDKAVGATTIIRYGQMQ